MTKPTHQEGLSLLRATDAARNWRAVTSLIGGGFISVSVLCFSVWLMPRSIMLALLCLLISLVLFLCTYSMTGYILMRQTQGQVLALADALVLALLSLGRLIGVALALILLALSMVLLAAFLLFMCKLPGIGSLLYAILMPVLSLLLGLCFIGLFGVAFPLAAPAIWQGNSVINTVARLITIIRMRLVDVITHMSLLSLLVGLLMLVLMMIIMTGMSTTTMLSGLLGVGAFDFSETFPQSTHRFGMRDSLETASVFAQMGMFTGNMQATGFAMATLALLAALVPTLTFIYGNCLIYLEVTKDLDFNETQQQLHSKFNDARNYAEQVRQRHEPELGETPAAVSKTPKQTCQHCQAPLNAGDIFCGNCGQAQPNKS